MSDRLPMVPADLNRRALPIRTIVDETFYRSHERRYDPIHFGANPDHRCTVTGDLVLYLSDHAHGAYLETVPLRAIPGLPEVGPTEAWIAGHAVADVAFTRALRVVDLTAEGLARLGLTNLFSTCDHRDAQRWSQAFWEHPENVDGILFRSRVDPSCCNLAIFQRAGVVVRPSVAPVSMDTRWVRILTRYGHVILPDDV